MPNDLSKKYFNRFWPLEFYKATSFIASFFIWMSLFLIDSSFLQNSHFTTGLVVGNGIFYFYTKRLSEYLSTLNDYVYYFIFQTVMIIGMSFAHHTNDFIYLISLPVSMTIYFYTIVKTESGNTDNYRWLYIYTIAFISLMLVESYRKGDFLAVNEVVSLLSFMFWTFSTMLIGFDLYNKFMKSGESKFNNNDLENNILDRMFFHDVINHTHALLLFLRSKKSNQTMSSEEIQSLVVEIKLLQETIHNHYGFNHKNLGKNEVMVSFHIAMGRVYNLVDSYFVKNESVTFEFRGMVSDTSDLDVIRTCKIDIISFHRVMTNLLKNAYEAGSDEIICIFDYQEDGLHFKVLNSLNRFSQNKMNLEKDLGQFILHSDMKASDHLGLESITKICQENGGSFHFSIDNGYWKSECFLANTRSAEQKIAA